MKIKIETDDNILSFVTEFYPIQLNIMRNA